jgi:hypothetical protein
LKEIGVLRSVACRRHHVASVTVDRMEFVPPRGRSNASAGSGNPTTDEVAPDVPRPWERLRRESSEGVTREMVDAMVEWIDAHKVEDVGRMLREATAAGDDWRVAFLAGIVRPRPTASPAPEQESSARARPDGAHQ